MNTRVKRSRLAPARWLLLIGIVAVVGLTPAHAQEPVYDLSWYTVDAGGGLSSEGATTLQGTVGQADTGAMSGGEYTVTGGFWGGATTETHYGLLLPLLIRTS